MAAINGSAGRCRASLTHFLRRSHQPDLWLGRLMRLSEASSYRLAQAGYIKIGAQGTAQIAIEEFSILCRP
jgi:hypothetical protein